MLGREVVISKSMVVRFLKGVVRLSLPVKETILFWDFSPILAALIIPLFEPQQPFLSFFCQKAAFLIAITSMRRVRELSLMVKPSYTVFQRQDGLEAKP